MNHFDFKCAKPKHHSAPVVFVCLETKCKNKRKCCIQCAEQNHIKHDLVSVQKFINEINFNLQKHNNHPEKHQIFKLLGTIRTDFSKSFISLKTNIIQKIDKLESKVNDFLNIIQDVITANSEQMIREHIINTFSQTQTILEDYLTQSSRASKIELRQFKEVKRKLYDYLECFQIGCDTFRCQLQKPFTNLQKVCTVNCLIPKKQTQNFTFSQINKPLCIQLEDSRKIIEHISAPYNYTVCCLDKPFDYSSNWFCVRIDKNPNKKIWIGVCSLNMVKKNNFLNCFGTGKGTYALDQAGGSQSLDNLNNFLVVSSHHDLKNNMQGGISPQPPKWNFKQGDIMYVNVDVIGNYVNFYLLNQQFDPQGAYPTNQVYSKSYSIEIKFPNSDLYGFVGVSVVRGDQVTILSRSQLEKITAVYGNKWLNFIGENDEEFEDEDQADLFW